MVSNVGVLENCEDRLPLDFDAVFAANPPDSMLFKLGLSMIFRALFKKLFVSLLDIDRVLLIFLSASIFCRVGQILNFFMG